MNYAIISINDDRREYKDRIRQRVGLSEVSIPSFNALECDPLAELERRGIKIDTSRDWYPKRGELGIWLSTMNVWEWAVKNDHSIIAFEDDAIPVPGFYDNFKHYERLLPTDWDFMALWVPDNQRNDYYYQVAFDEIGVPRHSGRMLRDQDSFFRTEHKTLAKVYQGYGGVANMFSPAGSAKFLQLVSQQGLWAPCDCYLYLAAHAGWVNGFAPHPKNAPPLVEYDWSAPTTIHNSEVI